MKASSISTKSGGAQYQTYIETHGFRDLARTLNDLDKTAKKELNRALKQAAQPVLAQAKATAPHKSGKLASSIRIRTNSWGVLIGSSLIYAPILEFAHKSNGGGIRRTQISRNSVSAPSRVGTGRATARMDYSSLTAKYGPPARFLIPSVDANAERIRADVDEAINDAIDRLVNRDFTKAD